MAGAQRTSRAHHPTIVPPALTPTPCAVLGRGWSPRRGWSQRAVTAEPVCAFAVMAIKPNSGDCFCGFLYICCTLFPNLPFCRGPQFTFMKNTNCRVIWCDEYLRMIPSVSSEWIFFASLQRALAMEVYLARFSRPECADEEGRAGSGGPVCACPRCRLALAHPHGQRWPHPDCRPGSRFPGAGAASSQALCGRGCNWERIFSGGVR